MLLLPAAHTYVPLPLALLTVDVLDVEAFVVAASVELEGRQKVVPPLPLLLQLWAPGDANGEDGALIGCVI